MTISHPAHQILLVEDDPTLQLIHQHLIEQCGYQAHPVSTGQAALERSAQTPYAAMVLDLGLPDMKGEEVLIAIRQREQETGHYLPILVNTAHGDEDILTDCLNKGADRALLKPISLAQFRQALAELIPPASY